MATRKKPPVVSQSGFAFPTLTLAAPKPLPEGVTPPIVNPPNPKTYFEADMTVDLIVGIDPAVPGTDETSPVVVERKLRLVPKPEEPLVPEEDVVVEIQDDGRYAVSLIRHHGGSVACVLYTRGQLEMLLARIPAALEVG